jgi:hypothetical protein
MALNNYVEVADRVKEFRNNEKYNGWSLRTEIIEHNNGMIVMKAIVRDETDRIISEGTAYEVNEAQGKNLINLTSYIENCETSAVGRALGFIGIGIDKSIASKDEVNNAVRQQERYTKNNPTHNEPINKEETNNTVKKVYWDGVSPIKQFDHFYDEEGREYITMKNKTTGELFGLITDESITDPAIKFYKFA